MKKFIYLLLLLPVLAMAQSEDQNYVKTLVYRDTTNTLAPHASVTYYDGLGRPIQQVAGKMSAEGMDIITHIEYDAYGRQVKKYLPYPTKGSTLEYDSAAQANTFSYYDAEYGDAYPYSESFLEPSPLGRVLKQSAPGASWRGIPDDNTDKTVKFSHQVNTGTEVKKLKATTVFNTFKVYNPSFSDAGYYAAGQLYKTVTKDENWTSGTNHTTEEFKNKEGQVVLKRTYIDGIKADTYYVYDQFGNLTYVLPPKAQGATTYLNDLCYQYKYDGRNRLAEKKLPGKQWEFVVYDSQDRVIATGPTLIPFGGATATSGNQGWLRTYYDAFGRVAFTGWYYTTLPATSTRNILQNSNNGAPVYATRGSGTIDNIAINYAVPSDLPAGFKLLTVNYYDDYLWLPTADRPTSSTQVEGAKVSLNTKGLLTGSWVRALQSPSSTVGETTYNYYDYRGRALRTKATNYLSGFIQKDSKLDFSGTPQYMFTQFKGQNGDAVITTREDFTYTPQDRLLSHTHKIGTGATQSLSANEYYALGQLKAKKVGGTATPGSEFQQVDYKYNIRGWLTDINDVSTLTQPGAPDDFFAYKISYDVISSDMGGRISPLYNGNISETQWRTGADDVLRKYSYRYDSSNRLLDAYYQKPEDGVPEPGSYNENITYDIGGNIMTMHRTGGVDDPNTVVEIDNLQYTYQSGSNLLNKVVDSSESPQGFKDFNTGNADYTYDANGNMLTDLNKGITGIKYNHLNLPVIISFGSSNSITYLYNGAGVKLKKTVVENGVTVTVDYLSGFQYKNGVLQFFPTAEGYVDNTVNSSGANVYSYVYQYKDHLGNARVNYAYSSGSKNPIVIPAGVLIKDESHYYPFGLKHLNYNVDYLTYQDIEDDIVLYPPLNSSAKLMYNYKYNGKELQEELGLNMYDYGARNYDPALGRWMNIDPLAETSRRWTPYNYCYNNPVVFVDPDGMKAKEVPDAAFSDWAGGPSADNQEAAFKGMSSNIGGHYDPGKSSASNNHGGGDKGGKSWFRRGWDKLFGGKKTINVTGPSSGVSDEEMREMLKDVVSDSWNSPIARAIVPDFTTIGVGFSGIAGVGGASSIELNWITRGPDASFIPITTVTQSLGGGFSIDATVNIGGANYLGNVNDIRRTMLVTDSMNNGDYPTAWGSAGLSAGGKIGVTGTYTSTSQGYGIFGRYINIGGGLPIVLPNAAGGVSNTYIMGDGK